MQDIIKIFLDEDFGSLAVLYGAAISELQGLRSGLVEKEPTLENLRHFNLGRTYVFCDLLSAMLAFLEEESRPDRISKPKGKMLYV